MGLSEAPGERDTQALLSRTQAMELRRRDYHVERPLLNQEQLEELGSRSPAQVTLQWRTWFRPCLCPPGWTAPRVWPLQLLLSCLCLFPVWDFPAHLCGHLCRHVCDGGQCDGITGSGRRLPAGLELHTRCGSQRRYPGAAGLHSQCPCWPFPGGAGHGPLRLRGHLPIRASGPSLHHGRVRARVCLATQVCVWPPSKQPLWTAVPHLLLEVCWKLPQMVVGTMVTAIVAGVVLVLVKLLNEKLRRHLPMPLPGELLTLIGATGISYGVGLKQAFGVDIVGKIPTGLVPPMAPRPQLFAKLLGNAFAIAVVGFAIAISLGKIFALRHGYRVYSNQELVALGLSNLLGGIFQCFPVSCSMSRSLVQESTGGNTQVAGAISSLFILIIIVKLGELFQDLPKAVLAAVVIVNLKGMVMQCTDVVSLWKANRMDLLIWVVTFVATILLNLDLGLAVAVVFSLMLVVVRTQMPHYSVLGQVPDTDIYRDVAEYSGAREVPGVKVFRSSVTVYFANAELYSDSLKQRCGVDVDYLLSQKKKLLRKQELKLKQLQKENKLPKQAAASKGTSVSINVNPTVMDIESNNDVEGSKAREASAGTELEDTGAWAPEDAKASDISSLKALGLPQPDFHTLILDLSSFSFVDTVCLKSLKNIFRDFREIEVEVYMAACHAPVITQLEDGHFFDASITKQHLFASVHDAVLFALQHRRSGPVDPVLVTKL
ncbi:solute carrier family 26 member 6 isoform X3 [Bos indicus]|uniref:Solute carrier family 26 member 6 isoform X3 n=1 Tax=Bos indicus TaxID=9915 RepID=A0ABM4RBA8_BOSIN